MKRFLRISIVLCAFMLMLSSCAPVAGKTTDGSYTGISRGFGGELAVNLTIKSGKIASLEVTQNAETPEYGGRAISELPAKIIQENSLGVDAISGATITSRAIYRAAAEAIEEAGGDPKDFQYTAMEDIRAADTVTVTGLPEGKTAQFTGNQLMVMDPVTVTATSVNASGDQKDLTATGVKLETLLQSLGVSQKSYAAIIMTASDGYSIEIPASVLGQRDIIIAWDVDGEPQSPRTIVPEERAMYWVKFLTTIELKDAVAEIPVDTVFLMESMLNHLADKSEDYKYYESMDKAVPVSAIFEAYIIQKPVSVALISTDQWGKNDKYDTVATQYIKFTGKDAPLFIGPTLPEGMRLKEIVSMKLDNAVILHAGMSAKKTGVEIVGGLPVAKVFELASMKEAASYRFVADDGYETVLSASDASKGVITVEDGSAVVRFEGLEKNTTVKGLLKMEAVDQDD